MKSLTRRLMPVVAAGALAVSVFAGCGVVGGAIDCVTVGDTMTGIIADVGGDEKTLKEKTKKLREQAKDIEDKDLRKSAENFADEAENVNAGANGDLAGGAETDKDKLKDSADKFMKSCNAL